MTSIRITGMGSYLPRRMLDNADLPPIDPAPTADDLAKIGVTRRGWAGPDEGIAEMGLAAARIALDRAGLEAEAIDLVLLSNWTQRRYIPEFAPRLQHLLGAHRAVAFDLCCACAGFVYGLSIAETYLREGRFRRALVVASETTSRRARPGSKATLVFGDAAGAWVLERDADRGGQLLGCELLTDGSHHAAMDIDEAGHVKTHIEQRELVKLAVGSFSRACELVLGRTRRSFADVDWIVPHSGTAGIQAALVRAFDVDPGKVRSNFDRVGNVSSAAIPVALDQLVRDGTIRAGQTVLSPTTGTGWYAAAAIYTVG